MPKRARYALIWSQANHTYDLLADDVFQWSLVGDEEQVWRHWLETQTVFSFQGRSGHLYVLKEARSRGEGYWYAYTYQNQRKVKRYLGKTSSITPAYLEEIAAMLFAESALSDQTTGVQSELLPTSLTPSLSSLSSLSSPSLVPPGSALWPDSLLLPKLLPPRLPATMVARAHLLAHLDQTLAHELTLLSAAAGFGKTTLLSAWAMQARDHCVLAWLSLEEQDNDPQRFWSYVIAALRMRQPSVGTTALNMLQSPQSPPFSTILTALINDLATVQEEVVLILDDFHVLNDPALVASVQFLLEHMPSRLHLILAGRYDPYLALPRWRARGQVVELRDRDLRFTHAEAVHFLTQSMHLPLTETTITLLEQRAEGWIAGLQLVALAMRASGDASTFVQRLSGSQRFILDYLQEEVLERQPQDIQDFLLRTSVLTRLHASLCQAVTAQASEQDSSQMLLMLEKANLFLVPLDEERHWYRLHSLFRDVLQARLRALSPELIPLLHQRAARWYAQQGDSFEAVEHALAGNDYAFAAELMEHSAEQMWSDGQGQILSDWFSRLPAAYLLAHGRIVLTGMLYLLNHTFYTPDEQWHAAVKRVEQTLAQMEPLLEHQEEGTLAEACLLRKRVALLRGWIATRDLHGWQNDVEQQRRHTARMQELAREDDAVWKMIPCFNLLSWETNRAALLPMLFALKQQAEQEKHEYEAIRVMDWICEAYQQAGRLHQIERIYREGLQRLQRLGKARALSGYFHLSLATLHWAWNQVEEAWSSLAIAMHFASTWQHVDIEIKGYSLSFHMLLAEGKQVEAEQVLLTAEQRIQDSQESVMRPWTIEMRGQLWLAQGNLVEAARWVAMQEMHLANIDIYYKLDGDFFTLIRAYIALQRTTEALQLIAMALSHAERLERTWDTISLLALQVVAHAQAREMTQARRVALHLLTLTEAEGMVRVYLDLGQPMQRVLQSLLEEQPSEWRASLHHTVRALLRAFEQATAHRSSQQQAPALSTSPATASLPSAPLASSFEPLTAREREVLHLLASGATNQQIADQLVIALATAKKHITNILGKLGAANRVQAIARARAYKLL